MSVSFNIRKIVKSTLVDETRVTIELSEAAAKNLRAVLGKAPGGSWSHDGELYSVYRSLTTRYGVTDVVI